MTYMYVLFLPLLISFGCLFLGLGKTGLTSASPSVDTRMLRNGMARGISWCITNKHHVHDVDDALDSDIRDVTSAALILDICIFLGDVHTSCMLFR